MVRCPNVDEDTGDPCGRDLQLRDRFCSQCGWKIDRTLFLSPTCQALLGDGTVCATALPPRSKFCPGCGARVRYRDQQDSATITPSTSICVSENLQTDVSSSLTFQSEVASLSRNVQSSEVTPESKIHELCNEKHEDNQSGRSTADVKSSTAPSAEETKSSVVSICTAPSGRKITTVQLQLSVPPLSIASEKKDGYIKQVPASLLQRGLSVPADTRWGAQPASNKQSLPVMTRQDLSQSHDTANHSNVCDKQGQAFSSDSQSPDGVAGINTRTSTTQVNKQQISISDTDTQSPGGAVDASTQSLVGQGSIHAIQQEEKTVSSVTSGRRRMSPHSSPKRPPPSGPGPIRAVHGMHGGSDRSNTQRDSCDGSSDWSNSQRLSEVRDKLRKFGKSSVLRKSHSMDDLSTIDSITESSIPCINIGDKKPKSRVPTKTAKKSKGKIKKTSSKKRESGLDEAAMPSSVAPDKNRKRQSRLKESVAMETASDTEGETTYVNEDTDHTSVDTVTEWTEASVSQPPDELPLDESDRTAYQSENISHQVPEQTVTTDHTELVTQPGSGVEGHRDQVTDQKIDSAVSSGQQDQSADKQTDQQTDSNGSSGQSVDNKNSRESRDSVVDDAEESEEDSSSQVSQSKKNDVNNEKLDTEDGKKKKVPTATLR